MLLKKLGLLWGIFLLMNSGGVHATGNSSPLKVSLKSLIQQEQQLQQQTKETHLQFLETLRKLGHLDRESGGNSVKTTTQTSTEVVFDSELPKFSVMSLPVALMFQMDGDSKTERQQLIDQKNLLEAKEKDLQSKTRQISYKIADTVGTSFREGSIDDLDLEQLANFLTWPVTSTKTVSSDYGWRNFNGETEFHSGIDVAADLGDSIHAAADGTVIFAGPAQGYGNWIVIRHPKGLMTIYGHMYKQGVNVKAGQTVKKGQLIGKVGADGQSDGPHLHFAVATGMKENDLLTVNPWSFLSH